MRRILAAFAVLMLLAGPVMAGDCCSTKGCCSTKAACSCAEGCKCGTGCKCTVRRKCSTGCKCNRVVRPHRLFHRLFR